MRIRLLRFAGDAVISHFEHLIGPGLLVLRFAAGFAQHRSYGVLMPAFTFSVDKRHVIALLPYPGYVPVIC